MVGHQWDKERFLDIVCGGFFDMYDCPKGFHQLFEAVEFFPSMQRKQPALRGDC